MSCEYATGERPNCNMTGKACLVICDEDKTAYRHCLRRDWKHLLEDRHSPLLQRPCSAIEDLVPQMPGMAPQMPGMAPEPGRAAQ